MPSKPPSSLLNQPEALREYFITDWVLQAVTHLEQARKAQCLTRQALADRLSTTPSSILRTERDDSGAISLRDYATWLVACEVIPLPVMTTHLPMAMVTSHEIPVEPSVPNDHSSPIADTPAEP